ncbi:cation:proton antiporter [Hoyosella sp. G463]|uniref:Cation:proton antiporter n=1 Tax=Lolliginicoccus lacisalsi TaxID=2742202 RepID=A0A927PN85_9ACTN|nr:monovalent cation/H+ antiporter complex subunit F [Lolliginicoccus lacisalsi]MBD8507381.1 cation:proton antiporter [Lolliginicoccus lacisalsi]
MTLLLGLSGGMLVLATLISSYRLVRGPNSLDRLVAIDMIVALMICGLAIWTIHTRDTTIVPAIVVLALLGFVGSISVTRYRVPDHKIEQPAGATAEEASS